MQIQKPKADAAQTRHHSAINLQQPISIQEGKLILNVRFQIISLPLRAHCSRPAFPKAVIQRKSKGLREGLFAQPLLTAGLGFLCKR
jgi:hypothetical protein